MVDDKIRKILLFSIILVLMVGIASAAGSNDTTPEHKITKTTQEQHDTVTATKNTTFEKKATTKDTTTKKATNTYTTTANNYNELVNKVNHAKTTTYDTYTINLKKGTYNITSTLNWYSTKGTEKLIINGNQATLDGQNKTHLMDIGDSYTAILNNVTITNNMNSALGGAIYNGGTLTVTNSHFINNNAGAGGAIYSFNTLTVTNSHFINNNAKFGGAIVGKTLTVTNSSFTNNNAKDIGGAIRGYETLTVTNSHFTNNTANAGGAISDDGTLTVSNSYFTNNNAKNQGGAIHNHGTLTVSNTKFINNKAEFCGAIGSRGGTLIVSNSYFTNNNAKEYSGAIGDGGILTISNSHFINNNAKTYGGAVYAHDGTLTVIDSHFINNTSKLYGGALYLYNGGLTVNNTHFTNNLAGRDGGAIGSRGTLIVTTSQFINNTAEMEGGAIYKMYGTLTVINSHFTNSNAKRGKSLYMARSILNSKNNNFTEKYSDEIRLNGGNLTINNNYFNKKKISKYTTSNLDITLELNSSDIAYGDTVLISGYIGEADALPSKALIKVNNEIYSIKIQNKHSGGYFELYYKAKKLGKYKVTVTYNKTKDYDSNTEYSEFYVKKPVNLVLFKVPVATKGKVSKISGKLLSNNKGIKGANVTININGKKYTAKTYSSGYFTVNYLVPTFNQRMVKASYAGSSVYSQASNKTTFNVRQKTKINILTKGNVQKGKSVKISGMLRLTKNNAGVKKQVVTVIVGSKKYTTKTYSSGYFAVNHKFDGSKTKVPVKFIFNGSTNYLESNATTTLKII